MKTAYHNGPENARLAIIAEAPAGVEMKSGIPLAGPSGFMLEQCLHSVQIPRAGCFVGNVCRTPILKATDVLTTKGWTERGADELRAFKDRLSLIKPNVIVALGNIALYALTGKKSILKWRGSILPCSIEGFEHLKIIPSVHPAFILRGAAMSKFALISDLDKAKRESAFPEIRPLDAELITDPSYDTVMDYLTECARSSMIAHDIEVYNLQVSCDSLSFNNKTAISIPHYDARNADRCRWTVEDELEIWRRRAEILENPEITKIGQNYIFDMTFLYMYNHILVRGPIRDIMIAHHIMYPDVPKGLDYLVSIHTDMPYYKDDKKLWSKIDTNQEEFWIYSAKDSIATFLVHDEIWPDLADGYQETYDFTIDLYDPLIYMTARGIKINMESLSLMKIDIKERIEKKHEELRELVGPEHEFNPASSKQVMSYFYDHLGIKPYLNRTTGNPTSDDTALERLRKQHGRPEAKILQELRSLSKLQSTYLEMVIDSDHRMRSTYNPRGTKFGRLSSSQTIAGTGGNMQNLDPRFKHFLEAG